MDENDTIDPDYQKGFNEGYVFAKYLPELSEQLSKTELKSSRGIGFLDGRKEFISEQVKDKFPDWLKGNRTNSDKTSPGKDRGRSIEPDK
ncbi:hypothetical protein [Dyadobacter sp. 32]|uniref:hypothetical protein n=1 Tax=Dyadobacter sp. 32 TaxID=538966 RepID=UPI0011ECAFF3